MKPETWGMFSLKLKANFSFVSPEYLSLVRAELGNIEDEHAEALIDHLIKNQIESERPTCGKLWAFYYALKKKETTVHRAAPPVVHPKEPDGPEVCDICGRTMNRGALPQHLFYHGAEGKALPPGVIRGM